MHVGNLRTALYAYLWAKKNQGDFILRIEDTDQERIVEGAVELIYRTLEETGLIWDEGPDKGGPYGPYIQHERKPIYKKYAEELIEKGVAYYCFCDKERLEQLRTSLQLRKLPFRYNGHCKKLSKEEIRQKLDAGVPRVVRQSIPTMGSTTFEDEVFGMITVENPTLDDQVLVKSAGMPTYNFANVVDDHLMRSAT
jgi:glutamyl-tRNA synthetase